MDPALVARITAASRPIYRPETGKWHKPVLSNRKLADLRKDLAAKGIPWEVPPVRPPPAPRPAKPFKGHKPDRPEWKEARRQAIEKSLKDMPKMIDQLHKQGREERKKAREKTPYLILNYPLHQQSKEFHRLQIEERRAKKQEGKTKKLQAASDNASAETPSKPKKTKEDASTSAAAAPSS